MIDESWTWIEKYRGWFRPQHPRLCQKCGYKGYYKLKESIAFVPNKPPFIEMCPDCKNQIELKEGENPHFYHPKGNELEKIAEMYGLTLQELIDKTFEKIIPEIDTKTGKIRFVYKNTGEELKFD